MMILWIDFVIGSAAIVTLIICLVIVLAKLEPADDSSKNLVLPPIPQENSENTAKKRRLKMLEKIKEEKIREYYNRKKQKN